MGNDGLSHVRYVRGLESLQNMRKMPRDILLFPRLSEQPLADPQAYVQAMYVCCDIGWNGYVYD